MEASLANKGEAEKCRDMAKKFLQQGEHQKAVRFCEKSLRLYPLPGVETMKDLAKVGDVCLKNGLSRRPAPRLEVPIALCNKQGAWSRCGAACLRPFARNAEVEEAKEGGSPTCPCTLLFCIVEEAFRRLSSMKYGCVESGWSGIQQFKAVCVCCCLRCVCGPSQL